MLQKFHQYIKSQGLFTSSSKIILTVSGGVDSMVMTKLFELSGFYFGIAHCNFKLRGTESDADAEFVQRIATELGVSFYLKEFETGSFAIENRISIQQAARDLRYRWFDELIQESDFNHYATAHHFDDQIETFFINLLRGAGISGLRGILPKNGHCIRPLLFANRIEIEAFARKHKLSFRTDSSNQSDHYLRNRIRHFVLPAFEKTRPDFRAGFESTFRNLADAENFIKAKIEKISSETMSKEDKYWKIHLGKLQMHRPLSFILFELLKPFGFNYENVLMILDSLSGIPGKSFFSPTHKILLDREYLVISELQDEDDNEPDHFFITEDLVLLDFPLKLSIDKTFFSVNDTLDISKCVAQLDVDKLNFPLEIRKPDIGDFFYPLGLGGKKKLSDFFTDEKFSAIQKQNTWLLLSSGEIVWIIGYRLDDRFKITPETRKILKITLLTDQ
ncbi:MAG: tRNA lysidine(34) synthetase TilS [Bacteroidales bacterium]|nr:tRNA lysidine(34) synthetase TilS [Bacteroidales bacterium]